MKDDALGKCTFMEKLINAQPGLIPQFGGHLSIDSIWAANVAVDQSCSDEDNFSGINSGC